MGGMLPQFSENLVIDGHVYHVTIRITEGELAAQPVPVHSHGQYEILAFMDGSAVMQVGDGADLTVCSGQCCVIHPNVYHLRRKSSDMTRCGAVLIQQETGSLLRKPDEACTLLQCAPEVLSCLTAMEREFRTPAPGSDSTIHALATLLLVMVLRELSDPPSAQTQRQRPSVLHYEEIIDDYLALHYAEDLRVGDLAEQAGITPRHLARIMQQRYQCTFRQRLTEIRLYHGKKYLAETDHRIGTIAALCGFASENSFSTIFRAHIGCAPSEYRKEHRG